MSSTRDVLIVSSIQDSIKVKQTLLTDSVLLGQIAEVVQEFVSALSSGHKLLLFGNGGSGCRLATHCRRICGPVSVGAHAAARPGIDGQHFRSPPESATITTM